MWKVAMLPQSCHRYSHGPRTVERRSANEPPQVSAAEAKRVEAEKGRAAAFLLFERRASGGRTAMMGRPSERPHEQQTPPVRPSWD